MLPVCCVLACNFGISLFLWDLGSRGKTRETVRLDETNHDLSLFGQKLWEECDALHDIVDVHGNQSVDFEAVMRVKLCASHTFCTERN